MAFGVWNVERTCRSRQAHNPSVSHSQPTMWNGGDRSELGEPVRLYQPIQYAGRVSQGNARVSFIGGVPSYFESDDQVPREHPKCGFCQDPMYLLVQLHVPHVPYAPNPYRMERSVYVFACNKADCWARFFKESPDQLRIGGDVITCVRSQPAPEPQNHLDKAQSDEPMAVSSWGADDEQKVDVEENDWDVEDLDPDVDAQMESMLEAMEVSGAKGIGKKEKKTNVKKPAKVYDSSAPQFKCFEIHQQQEPAAKHVSEAMDDDDVGLSSGNDDKIQKMLEKYMAEEEDEEIISALKGSSKDGGQSRAESDERLPAEDRAMLAFTDRIKRAPRQVLRCAKGGEPLVSW